MKKILCMLLAVLLVASLGSAAFADETIAYEDNGFTLTYTDEFNNENLKGSFVDSPSGMIDDGLFYAKFNYLAMSDEELNLMIEKSMGEFTEADLDLIRSKHGTLAIVYGIDFTKISDENLEIHKSMEDRVTEIAKAGDVVFYRYNLEDAEDTLTYLAGIAPVYQEEYKTLQAAFDKVLENAEFYVPFIRGEDLVGTVISFETTDLDGNPVKSEDIFKDHKITMVNLWATWCHNCIGEMTELGEMAERLAEKDVAVVGICTDADEELDLCKEVLKEHNVNYLRGAPQTMDPYEEIINGLLNGEVVETESPDTPHTAANDAGVYRVIVSDTDGNLVKGVTVQFCSDSTCMMGKTDANGVASFEMEEGAVYTVHILKVPEGYAKNTAEYQTDDTYCDIYIPLDKAA